MLRVKIDFKKAKNPFLFFFLGILGGTETFTSGFNVFLFEFTSRQSIHGSGLFGVISCENNFFPAGAFTRATL